MGSSASVSSSSSVHYDLVQSLRSGCVWIEFSLNTTSPDQFHMVEMICGSPQATLGASTGKMSLVTGYSWDKCQVPKPEDCDGHFNKDGFVAFPEEKNVIELADAMGLNSKYREHFPKPSIIPNGYVFVNCMFLIRSPNGESFRTQLSGCIRKADILKPVEEFEELPDAWATHAVDVLPGPRFEQDRAVFSKWWPLVQKQLNSIGEVGSTKETRVTFFNCVERRSAAYQKMLAQNGDPEKCRRFREEVGEWQAKTLAAATTISGAIVDTVFAGGMRLIGLIFQAADTEKQKAIAIERLKEAKTRLMGKFDRDILDLAAAMESLEEKAWQQLNSRYANGTIDGDGNPMSVIMNASERTARNRLTSLLALMKMQESQLQDAVFIHGSRFEFEFILFEIFTTSRLDAYYTKTRARLQTKWERNKSAQWNALQVEQAKLRAQMMTQDIPSSQLDEMNRQHDDEDQRLENKLNMVLRKKESQFEEIRDRTMKVYWRKLDAIRKEHERAILSSPGLEKLKAICQIYQRLRPK